MDQKPGRKTGLLFFSVIVTSVSDEAIHASIRGKVDCFVASLLAMTTQPI
jgi:hypothetical protein